MNVSQTVTRYRDSEGGAERESEHGPRGRTRTDADGRGRYGVTDGRMRALTDVRMDRNE